MRFWNEFNAEIEISALLPVSKFSYLKELLALKAKVLINGLLFNAERYEKPRVILESAYGKPSEVAKAYVQEIVGLPTSKRSKNPQILRETPNQGRIFTRNHV